MSALLIYPTHKNCREAEEAYVAAGIDAACYPARSTTGDSESPPNCWNPNADLAEEMGFPVLKTVCSGCNERSRCLEVGYLQQLIDVQSAYVALCTHKRAEYSGLDGLMKGRKFISIHENPVDLLRPRMQATEADLLQVQVVLDRLLHDPVFLNYFGALPLLNDDGCIQNETECADRRDRQFQFSIYLAGMVANLITALKAAEHTVEWSPVECRQLPEGIEQTLFLAVRVAAVTFREQPWRFVLAAAAGAVPIGRYLVQRRHDSSRSVDDDSWRTGS